MQKDSSYQILYSKHKANSYGRKYGLTDPIDTLEKKEEVSNLLQRLNIGLILIPAAFGIEAWIKYANSNTPYYSDEYYENLAIGSAIVVLAQCYAHWMLNKELTKIDNTPIGVIDFQIMPKLEQTLTHEKIVEIVDIYNQKIYEEIKNK